MLASRPAVSATSTAAVPSTFRFPHPVLLSEPGSRSSEMKPENLSLDQRARHAAEAMACLAATPVSVRSGAQDVDDVPELTTQSTIVLDSGRTLLATSSLHNEAAASNQSPVDKYSGYDRHFKKKFFGSDRRTRCDSSHKDERVSSESGMVVVMDDPRDTTPSASPDSNCWENAKGVSASGQFNARTDSRVSPVSSSGMMNIGDSLNLSITKQHTTSSVRLQTVASVKSRNVLRSSPLLCNSPVPLDSGSFQTVTDDVDRSNQKPMVANTMSVEVCASESRCGVVSDDNR